jgi:hypothetical protein
LFRLFQSRLHDALLEPSQPLLHLAQLEAGYSQSHHQLLFRLLSFSLAPLFPDNAYAAYHQDE